MNYKEKYKQALERAREQYNKRTPLYDIEYIFPELKESEEERIRKAIKKALQVRCDGSRIISDEPVTLEEAIAWLEKQNKQSSSNIPSRELILSIWDLGNEWKELTNGSISTEYGTQLEYIQKHWHESEYYLKEKQGEKDPCIGCTNDKGCVTCENGNLKEINVKPKFKVRDWVVNSVCFPMQIASIKDGMYIFTKGDAMSVLFIDGNFHLWTINDAMDGDVLIRETGEPFIYNGNRGSYIPEFLGAYCGISDGKFRPNGSPYYWGRPSCPATKEQHDLLFQKMKEAGYEWDSEKKELKKIETASKDSEDENIRKALHIYLDWLDGRKDYAPKDIYSIKDMIAWVEKQKKD